MRIELDKYSTVYANASSYYEQAKKIRKKIESLVKEIGKSEKELTSKKIEEKPTLKNKVIKREKFWYEKFRWFFSSDGFMILAGRDQKQNELLVSKYLSESDLFMHADVHGAPAVIIKNGQNASEKTLLEAAYFAASYSSAWKNSYPSADVYAVKPDQVSTAVSGQYVAKGSFVIKGVRKWFKSVPLQIFLSFADKITVLPGDLSDEKIKEMRANVLLVQISPGNKDKKELVDDIKRFSYKRKLEVDLDELYASLPSGMYNWVVL